MEVVKQECERIQQKNGLVRPHDLVEASRPEDAPLHNQFEWDDKVAGEEYRVWQARKLIVRVQYPEKMEKRTPMYINVKISEKEQGYMPISVIVQRESLRNQVLKDALKMIKHWQEKYSAIEELADLINQEKLSELEQQTMS